jgi:hypothetical protein
MVRKLYGKRGGRGGGTAKDVKLFFDLLLSLFWPFSNHFLSLYLSRACKSSHIDARCCCTQGEGHQRRDVRKVQRGGRSRIRSLSRAVTPPGALIRVWQARFAHQPLTAFLSALQAKARTSTALSMREWTESSHFALRGSAGFCFVLFWFFYKPLSSYKQPLVCSPAVEDRWC